MKATQESRAICDAVKARVVDEWQVIGWYGVCAKGGSAPIAGAERRGPNPQAVAEYIAHFDPRLVSGMLDDMDRLARLREGLEKLERCEVNRGIGEPDPSGDWVQWTDILALLERGEQATSKLAAVERDTVSVLEQQRDGALDRMEKLRKGLGKLPVVWVRADEGTDRHKPAVYMSDIRKLLDEDPGQPCPLCGASPIENVYNRLACPTEGCENQGRFRLKRDWPPPLREDG
jgi:hypothetical protein